LSLATTFTSQAIQNHNKDDRRATLMFLLDPFAFSHNSPSPHELCSSPRAAEPVSAYHVFFCRPSKTGPPFRWVSNTGILQSRVWTISPLQSLLFFSAGPLLLISASPRDGMQVLALWFSSEVLPQFFPQRVPQRSYSPPFPINLASKVVC